MSWAQRRPPTAEKRNYVTLEAVMCGGLAAPVQKEVRAVGLCKRFLSNSFTQRRLSTYSRRPAGKDLTGKSCNWPTNLWLLREKPARMLLRAELTWVALGARGLPCDKPPFSTPALPYVEKQNGIADCRLPRRPLERDLCAAPDDDGIAE